MEQPHWHGLGQVTGLGRLAWGAAPALGACSRDIAHTLHLVCWLRPQHIAAAATGSGCDRSSRGPRAQPATWGRTREGACSRAPAPAWCRSPTPAPAQHAGQDVSRLHGAPSACADQVHCGMLHGALPAAGGVKPEAAQGDWHTPKLKMSAFSSTVAPSSCTATWGSESSLCAA